MNIKSTIFNRTLWNWAAVKINIHNREILQNTPSKNMKHCNYQEKLKLRDEGCLSQRKFSATISCKDKNYKPKMHKGSC